MPNGDQSPGDPVAEVTLDKATHVYTTRAGVVLPSVTQVLQEAGLVDTQWYTEEGSDRGRNVAMITELHDQGRLERDMVPDDLLGYLQAWVTFRDDTKCQILDIERIVHNSIYGFAGMLDRRGIWASDEWLLDIKLGAVAPWEPLQTAGYAGCFPNGQFLKRGSVHLKPNGTYRLHIHGNFEHDWAVFRGALAAVQWKREHMKGRTDGGSD